MIGPYYRIYSIITYSFYRVYSITIRIFACHQLQGDMDKDTIKRLIIEYQQFVANITLIEREIHLSHQLNYVFVGLRRAGKSVSDDTNKYKAC